MNRRWICNDVLMDILPFFGHAQLGLKLALLSPRFNALVDKHFDGKSELTIWRQINIRKAIGPKPKFTVLIDGKSVEFPLPDSPMPDKIRFKDLRINYLDHSVITFLRSNKRIWDRMGTNLTFYLYSLDADDEPIWEAFTREIWPIYATNIRHLQFTYAYHLDDLRRLISPTILTDLVNQLDSINSYLFPDVIADDGPNATAGQALSKWLNTPRKDGQPKQLFCAFIMGEAKITRLFWGSYDGHIWKLDITSTKANNGTTNLAERRFTVVVAKFDASRHGFLRTNPLLIMISPNNQIFTPPLLLAIFGTLNGTLYAVSCKEFNSILWSLRMDSPIFAAPIAFIGHCLSLSVKGQLLLVEPENGHIISAFSALSNYGHQFFDSPTPLIGDVNQIDAAKQQQQQLLLISAGSNSLLLLSYNYRNESPTQSDYCKAAESNKGRCSVAAGGFSVLRRFLVPCQSAAGECIVRRPILFEQHQQRRFAFLLTNKGTLFRLWLDDELLLSLPSPSSLLPYPNPAGNDKDDSALPSPTAAAGGTVVARPSPPVLLLLDCVFTMDQQQLETFGHPLLLRHDNCCDYASSTTTMQHDDAVDDPPFVVVFGARDDLLRARFCVPRPRHSSQ